MRLITQDDLRGKCEVCGTSITFQLQDDGDVAYYEAAEIVNNWMDHQLNDCKPPVIDNPSGIGYSDFITSKTLEDKVGPFDEEFLVTEDDDDEDVVWEEDEEEDDDDEPLPNT